MASPQVEDGHLKIADSLMVAICRAEFTAIQFKLLFSIMNMTYRVGKTKADISVDDLRYATGMKKYRVDKALEGLLSTGVVFHQRAKDGGMILGLQKDFEKWGVPQSGSASDTSITSNIYINTRRGVPQSGNDSGIAPTPSQTPPQKFLRYCFKQLAITPSVGMWRIEHKRAVKLYEEALELAHGPVEAMTALVDYFDSQATPSFRARIKYPMAVLQTGFAGWYRQIPDKPSKIKFQEKVTGKRWKYDLQKGWCESEHRI